MTQLQFIVSGMTCSACSAHVEKDVAAVKGVQSVTINLLTGTMAVTCAESVTPQILIEAVEKAGYSAQQKGAETKKNSEAKQAHQNEYKEMERRLWVSFGFLVPLMYVAMGHMLGLPLPQFLTGMGNAVSFAFTQFLLCLPVLYVNRSYYTKGFTTLLRGKPNMDSLIAIGSAAAVIYGVVAIYRMSYGLGANNMDLIMRYHMDLYFESAAMILALITFGKYLEARSKGKTSEALEKLMDLAPKTATVQRNGAEQVIPAEEVQIGDIVIIKPGQSVPVDGVIIEGASSLDEAAVTGESVPAEKTIGDTVIAASINQAGFLKFRATKVGQDTTLAQIIHLVEEASATKAPIAKLADKISGVFVPIVIAIAVFAAGIWLLMGQDIEFSLSVGIAVLVISCPCALGLATPVAIMVGTGKGAENGVLIKSGQALETAHGVTAILLDKTGTLTQGKPEVTDIVPFGVSGQELLQLAASLEAASEHPLAQAIVSYAKQNEIAPFAVEAFEAVFGKGIFAKIKGEMYYAGNAALLQDFKIAVPEEITVHADQFAQQGKTPLLFADAKKVIGIIAVADTPKPTSAAAVQALLKMGIDVTMLTGDNERTAKAIAAQMGISHVVAGVLPHQKASEVQRLQDAGHIVAMVGDGINDAPALAKADVGVAIGAGTDIAMESADIVLIKNDLQDVVTAIRLSRAVLRNIKQNLFWAFFYNTIGIPVAAGLLYPIWGVLLSPMLGAAAMSLSSVCVVANALRLRNFKPTHFTEIQSLQNTEEKQMKTIILTIEGMSCAHCSGRVEAALNALEGVNATVNLEQKQAVCTVEQTVSTQSLIDAVTQAGYTAAQVQ